MSRLSLFVHELRRRNVIRSGLAYVVTAWLIVQAVAIVIPVFDLPEWVLRAVVIVLGVGLPLVLIFSWFFEHTAAGIMRAENVPYDEFSVQVFGRRTDFIIIAILAAALSLSLYGNFRAPDEMPEPVSILIADFDNQSGTELFSGVIEESLRVGMEVAPFVDTFSRKVARSVAAGMAGTAAEETVLDVEAAGLVALRQGLDIVIGGSIGRGEGGLILSATAVSPRDERELFSVTQSAENDAEILAAVAAIARQLRLELGDTDGQTGEGAKESFAVANLEAAAEYLKAQDLQLDRKLEEALTHYRNAISRDPEFARAYAGLALTEQYLGNTDAATLHWQEALARLDTLTERGHLRTLANYYMINQRNYDQAIETYEELISKYPADNVAHNNLAVTSFYALDFGRALEVGRIVAERFPDHSGYAANLALFAMYASRFDEASTVASRVIENDPSSVYALVVVALTSAVQGDLIAAERAYERMARLDQYGKSVAHEGLADIAMHRGDYASAIEILDRAIAAETVQNATHPVALQQAMRAEALLHIGRSDEARQAVEQAVLFASGDPAVLVPSAVSLIKLGDLDAAEDIAVSLSKKVSKSDRAYASFIRARAADASGDTESAIRHTRAALDSADLWLVRKLRGDLYRRAGRDAEAADDYRICRERIGEGIAVFLNDRPSFRLIAGLQGAPEH